MRVFRDLIRLRNKVFFIATLLLPVTGSCFALTNHVLLRITQLRKLIHYHMHGRPFYWRVTMPIVWFLLQIVVKFAHLNQW